MVIQRTPEEVIEILASALLRTEVNFNAAVRGLPVRDMAETLAENTAALETVTKLLGKDSNAFDTDAKGNEVCSHGWTSSCGAGCFENDEDVRRDAN